MTYYDISQGMDEGIRVAAVRARVRVQGAAVAGIIIIIIIIIIIMEGVGGWGTSSKCSSGLLYKNTTPLLLRR